MPVAHEPQAQWVSAAQIPVVFGVSPKEIQRAIDNGHPIRRRYWGRKPLYSAADIDRHIDGLPKEANA